MGENRIFQQIAWGLAQQGVDVLRYDDRTYAYPWDSVALGNTLDIGYETVDDAVSAAALLKGMGYEKVVVIGHSLGGMMAPAIVQESDGLYDGMVSMAGSPRSLAEISYDQNMLFIDTIPDGELKEQNIQYVEQQLALAGTLDSMTEEQLLTTTVFGMSAYYLKSIEDYDIPDIALNLDVPMLFLQGMSDWQVRRLLHVADDGEPVGHRRPGGIRPLRLRGKNREVAPPFFNPFSSTVLTSACW